jgi:hypothetical protein
MNSVEEAPAFADIHIHTHAHAQAHANARTRASAHMHAHTHTHTLHYNKCSGFVIKIVGVRLD